MIFFLSVVDSTLYSILSCLAILFFLSLILWLIVIHFFFQKILLEYSWHLQYVPNDKHIIAYPKEEKIICIFSTVLMRSKRTRREKKYVDWLPSLFRICYYVETTRAFFLYPATFTYSMTSDNYWVKELFIAAIIDS
jgi:hypothetical protein